jgi:Arc/MetJ-type ribon-helix-helix transcriptional regulator
MKRGWMHPKTVTWTVKAPRLLDEMLNQAVKRGYARTKAEFIRLAVAEKLNELGISQRDALRLLEEVRKMPEEGPVQETREG